MMKLSEIYKILDLSFRGDDIEILSLNSLNMAKNSEMSYCDSSKNSKFIEDSKAAAILVKSQFASLAGSRAVVVENPHLAFAVLSRYFAKPLFKSQNPPFIDQTAKIMPNSYISNGSKIGANTTIMPGVFIGENVQIDSECTIYPNVAIYNDTIIGKGCIIHANAVIGSDGFGFAHHKDGSHEKIYHNGWVELGDHVEIGACTTIDRGVFEPTIIKSHSKIDNLVQIGHNCEIGFGSIIVSQTGLAGSTKLGRNVVMGGQSGTSGHLCVGDFAKIAARGGVTKNLEGTKDYAGYPAMPIKEWFSLQATILRNFKTKKK